MDVRFAEIVYPGCLLKRGRLTLTFDTSFCSLPISIVQVDDFTKKMWNIYETVRQDKAAQVNVLLAFE